MDTPGAIRRIIEAAIQAPSGENAQPWRFKIHGDTIAILNCPERDQSLYNYKQRGSLISHGAAIENMSIAAQALGYQASYALLPEGPNSLVIATMTLKKASTIQNALYKVVPDRCTNRKVYRPKPLTDKDKQILEKVTYENNAGIKVAYTSDSLSIKELGYFAAANERIMLEHHELHQFFFSHVTWTEAEDKRKNVGFYIKTLELPPPARIAFRILKSWTAARVFKALGATKQVQKQNAQTYAACSLMGAISIPQIDEPTAFVQAGILFERIWLTAASLGLALQPLIGWILLYHASKNKGISLPPQHLAFLEDGYKGLTNIFKNLDGHPILLFRLGYADSPTARSTRLPYNNFMAHE